LKKDVAPKGVAIVGAGSIQVKPFAKHGVENYASSPGGPAAEPPLPTPHIDR
jgi:hypothetical protein